MSRTGLPRTWSQRVAALGDADRASVVADGTRWSGVDLLRRARGAAEFLDAAGARPGGPVPALLPSSPDALALAVAGAATQRPLAPFSPRQTVDELRECLGRLGSPVILTDPAALPLAEQLAARTGARPVPLAPLTDSERPLPEVTDPEQVAFVVHTSGTTGVPKRVDYRQGTMLARCAVFAELLELGPGDVYATASPFHHVSGLGTAAAILGCGAAVAPVAQFSLESWRALRDIGVTHATTVPTVLYRLLDAGALDLPTLRVLQYGGAPISHSALARLQRARPDLTLVQFFGQTEGTPLTWLSSHDHELGRGRRPDLLRSVGRSVPGTQVRISAPDATGEGEVLARGPHLAGVARGQWLATGDLGRVDADGYLFLTGRKSDKIIRGGENLFPHEVEHVLEDHPGVKEAAVVGVPDEELGERVKAFLVATGPGRRPSEDELRAFARSRLSGFKVPGEWEWVDELPRNPVGKLLRRRLLESSTHR